MPDEIKKMVAGLLEKNEQSRMTAEQAKTALMPYSISKTSNTADKEKVKSSADLNDSKFEKFVNEEIEKYFKDHPATSSIIKKLRAELGPFKYGPSPFPTRALDLRKIDYVDGKNYFAVYVGEVLPGTDIRHGRGVRIGFKNP